MVEQLKISEQGKQILKKHQVVYFETKYGKIEFDWVSTDKDMHGHTLGQMFELTNELGKDDVNALVKSPFTIRTTSYSKWDDMVWGTMWNQKPTEANEHYFTTHMKELGVEGSMYAFNSTFLGTTDRIPGGSECYRCGDSDDIYTCTVCDTDWCDNCFDHRIHECLYE
jgi:hypothetical protein